MTPRRERKGTVYARGQSLWLAYWEVNGKRRHVASGLKVGQEREARRMLERLAQDVREAIARGDSAAHGPVTVGRYKEKWVKARHARKLSSAHDDEVRLRHTASVDHLLLEDFRSTHARDLIRQLRSESQLAHRSIRKIYAVLRSMFADATLEYGWPQNPCIVAAGELPGVEDADPAWREGAIYTRGELEQLGSDPCIERRRRVLYATLFATGLRIGELAARTWADWDGAIKPLGKLHVHSSWNRKEKRIKPVKARLARRVPVHPALAPILSEWKLNGWAATFGRAPLPGDLLIPSATGLYLRDPVVHADLIEDLARLGLRARRTHDTRRTFVSLGLEDGANGDILKWVSHGPPRGAAFDLYKTLTWQALCREVMTLRISFRRGELARLPLAVGGEVLQSVLRSDAANKKAPESQGLGGLERLAQGGIRNRQSSQHETASGGQAGVFALTDGEAGGLGPPAAAAGCHTVTSSPLADRGAADYEPRAAALGLREIRWRQ